MNRSNILVLVSLALTIAGCNEPVLGDSDGGVPDLIVADRPPADDLPWLIDAAKSNPANGSCDQRTSVAMPQPYCQDYVAEAAIVAPYRTACTGTWTDTGCPLAQALGGCRKIYPNPPMTITTWYYAGGSYKSAAEVMQVCKDVFVAP